MVAESAIKNFDFAICSISAFLVPRLISRERLYYRTLRRSPQWVYEHVAQGTSEGADASLEKAQLAVTRSMYIALAVSITIYTATAIVVPVLTRNIDNRTSYIIVGLSNVICAIFIFLLSYSAPQWLGVYSSVYNNERRTPLGANLDALCFKVRLHVYRTFFRVYPLVIPFFLGARPLTIPLSVIGGTLIGFLLCYAINYVNKNYRTRNKRVMRRFALGVAGFFIVGSGLMFSFACSYIEKVWGDLERMDGVGMLEVLSFIVWVGVGLCCHVLVWKVSRDMRRRGRVVVKQPRTFFGSSIFVSGRHFPTLHRPSMAIGRRSIFGRESIFGKPAIDEKALEEDTASERRQTVEQMSTIEEGDDKSEMTGEVEAGRASSSTPLPLDTVDEDPRDDAVPKKRCSIEAFNEHATSMEFGPEEPKESDEDEHEEEEPEEDDDVDNHCHLVNVVCCHLSCGQAGKQKPFSDKCTNCLGWTLWGLLMAASLFFVVLLIGAQQQEEMVRDLLPEVHHILYSEMNTGPVCTYDDNYDAVTIRERVEATQRTFPNPEEAALAGYTVLHCGACAACSNYPDMRQQWSTREILGQVALTCAKKTLFGGGYDALRECTMEKTGFEYDCATCWTTDYVCVKKNCLFISIRAFMINTVTNLQVGEDDVTPSACEEAMCEATEITGYTGFVPCSGASRRRMDIISSIKRPLEQQCRNVQVPSWARFFGPSTGHGDYPEDWNATTLE